MLYEYDDAADFSKTLPNFDGCHDKIEKTVMSERMQLGFFNHRSDSFTIEGEPHMVLCITLAIPRQILYWNWGFK